MNGNRPISIPEPLHQPWTEAACLGYAIAALENLDYKFNDIWPVVAELKELFDWVSIPEAAEHYRESRY